MTFEDYIEIVNNAPTTNFPNNTMYAYLGTQYLFTIPFTAFTDVDLDVLTYEAFWIKEDSSV